MLGIRDILVQSGYVNNGSGSNSGSGSTLDLTPFFSDFKDAKKIVFLIFFSLLTRRYLLYLRSSVFIKIYFFAKILCKNLFCKHYLSPLNTFMRKRKDPDWYMYRQMDHYPGGPKTCGSWIRNPNTMFYNIKNGIRIPLLKTYGNGVNRNQIRNTAPWDERRV